MGIQDSTAGNDAASVIVSGNFTATGNSGTTGLSGYGWGKSGGDNTQSPSGGTPNLTVAAMFFRDFNFAIWGTFSATLVLEKSFDGGTTYLPCNEDNTGTSATYTGPVNLSGYEPEYGVFYRWHCTVYASGTVNYRISQ